MTAFKISANFVLSLKVSKIPTPKNVKFHQQPCETDKEDPHFINFQFVTIMILSISDNVIKGLQVHKQ